MMDEEENVGQIIKLTKGSVGIIAVKLIIYCGVRERERSREGTWSSVNGD